MQPTNNRLLTNIRVLIAGALPPPMGGVGFYYQTLLSSSLKQRVNLHFVQTSSQNRELSSTGKATLFNFLAALKDCWRFTKALFVSHPQIAHISTAIGLSFVKHTYCIVLGKLFRAKVLLHPHCSLSALYMERSKWWQWYFRQVIRLTDGIIALSQEWLQLSSIIPAKRVYYLPNAINIHQYRKIAEKHLSEINHKERCKVLYLGYLGKAKGSFDLVDALTLIHSAGIELSSDLVGGALVPEELACLREKVVNSHVGNSILLHSLAYGDEKLGFLQEADIFIYPSYFEGMPMAVLEAMACGLPIVATAVGGLPDLVQDGVNGILVEPRNPEKMASALVRLARDPKMRNSMGSASYQLAKEHYDIEQHVDKLIDIYNMVLFQRSQ